MVTRVTVRLREMFKSPKNRIHDRLGPVIKTLRPHHSISISSNNPEKKGKNNNKKKEILHLYCKIIFSFIQDILNGIILVK